VLFVGHAIVFLVDRGFSKTNKCGMGKSQGVNVQTKGKVLWSEGMFLRPQHFQQEGDYLEWQQHHRCLSGRAHFWGFHEITIDADALALGKVLITSAHGVLPDGTPFRLPSPAAMLAPFEVPVNTKDEKLILAASLARDDVDQVAFGDNEQTLARYQSIEVELADLVGSGGEAALVQLGRLRLKLMLAHDFGEAWTGIGVLRIVERRVDNKVLIDTGYIPPTLSLGQEVTLAGFVTEIEGLLRVRSEALAARLSQPGRGGVSEVGDFLLLQSVNRWQPLLHHYRQFKDLHPLELFQGLLQLAGELATFSRSTRRPPDYPEYDHDDLAGCFAPLMADLRNSLSMVIEQNVISIPLHERPHGVRVAIMPSADLVKTASFVLAVNAAVPAETVRSHFPTQVKIGPVEKIRDLVNLHLPGVSLRALPVAPRQLPYNAGYTYFELDTTADLWKQLDRSGGLAMHIAGDFPELALEFWAIRAERK
jgi:type VI secretion system protein ImpJ